MIDDDSSTNFLNKMIIDQSKAVDEVLTFDQPEVALDYFKGKIDTDEGALVLLDINMPIMNGWEFLEEFIELNGKLESSKVVMLTSSIDPADKKKAEENHRVSALKSKPLSVNLINELVREYLT